MKHLRFITNNAKCFFGPGDGADSNCKWCRINGAISSPYVLTACYVPGSTPPGGLSSILFTPSHFKMISYWVRNPKWINWKSYFWWFDIYIHILAHKLYTLVKFLVWTVSWKTGFVVGCSLKWYNLQTLFSLCCGTSAEVLCVSSVNQQHCKQQTVISFHLPRYLHLCTSTISNTYTFT